MKRVATTSLTLVCALCLAAGCGPVAQPTPHGGSSSQGGNIEICNSSHKCPAGQYCFNGACAVGCNSNGDCAQDQYCDTADLGPPYFCKNKTVPSCPSNPCAESQTCRKGLCSATEVPNTQCTPTPSGQDGCDKYSVCIDEDDQGPRAAACLSFAPCPQNGVCPVGTEGAVCNDGYLPNKGRFCMPGLCHTVAHCPADWFCVKQSSNQPLGVCSPGSVNSPCFRNEDCLSKSCNQPGGPGFVGFCQ